MAKVCLFQKENIMCTLTVSALFYDLWSYCWADHNSSSITLLMTETHFPLAGFVQRALGDLQWGTWECWLMKGSTWAGSVCLQTRKPAVPWIALREVWPAGQGRWFCPSTLLSWDPTWSTTSSCIGPPTQEEHWAVGVGPSRRGPQRWSESWSTSPVRTGW